MSETTQPNGRLATKSQVLIWIASGISIAATISWTLLIYMSGNFDKRLDISKDEISVLRTEFHNYRLNVNEELRALRGQVLTLSRNMKN